MEKMNLFSFAWTAFFHKQCHGINWIKWSFSVLRAQLSPSKRQVDPLWISVNVVPRPNEFFERPQTFLGFASDKKTCNPDQLKIVDTFSSQKEKEWYPMRNLVLIIFFFWSIHRLNHVITVQENFCTIYSNYRSRMHQILANFCYELARSFTNTLLLKESSRLSKL